MRRRNFIAGLGSATFTLPLTARAQKAERPRRVGVIMNLAADDPEGKIRSDALHNALQKMGWVDGGNLLLDYRWGAGDAGLFRKYAEELVALAPEVILATGTPVVEALQHVTRTVPIVFVTVVDPVHAGFVKSLARPGGNITGFNLFEFSMCGKWVEFLKEVTPDVTRAAVLRDPTIASGTGQLAAIQAVAPSFRVELNPMDVHDAGEIERSVAVFAQAANGGVIVTASTLALVHRKLFIALAERHRLAAIYGDRTFAVAGGLITYGPNRVDPYRRAASYLQKRLTSPFHRRCSPALTK